MFYGDYKLYKELKYSLFINDKDEENIKSFEKYHPEWLYKITREELDRLIHYYNTFSPVGRIETIIGLMTQGLISEKEGFKLLHSEDIK